MVRTEDENRRWCAAFAATLVDETRIGAADALFLAEQARVCCPGLPPSYAVRMALTNSHPAATRVAASRPWIGGAHARNPWSDEGAVDW